MDRYGNKLEINQRILYNYLWDEKKDLYIVYIGYVLGFDGSRFIRITLDSFPGSNTYALPKNISSDIKDITLFKLEN